MQTGAFAVERINYDSSTSRLNVSASAATTSSPSTTTARSRRSTAASATPASRSARSTACSATPRRRRAACCPTTSFEFATVATTRGWLSRGTSRPLVAQGGHNDTFVVYSNHAPVALLGGTGDNLFVIQGFALARVDDAGELVLAPGCGAISAPNCLPLPQLTSGFSTAADTKVRTGAGNNQVVYNMNAPVSVDGGDGFNKLVIRGTEFADHIVVTDEGVFGVGIGVTYRNIQLIEVNGLEGDDTIDVLSTQPEAVVRIIGGLGSDQVNVAGDVNGSVFSQDLRGSSAAINQLVMSTDRAYAAVVAQGVRL